MQKAITIAIDGPVAAGKGTVASIIAKKIQGININSGAVYRAFALKCLREGLSEAEEGQIGDVIKKAHVDIEFDPNDFSKYEVLLDGEDVTQLIYTPEVSNATARFGIHDVFVTHMSLTLAKIIEDLKSLQRPIIMEGRNIGTEVMPNADIKIFLTANLLVRAKRRVEQYHQKGVEASIETVEKETVSRDKQDTSRRVAPLPLHPEKLGYCIIDNSNEKVEDTIHDIMQLLKEKKYMKDKKDEKKIQAMKSAGKILARALATTLEAVKPGITEAELDKIAEKTIVKNGGYPAFKKVPGYKHTICAATNDVVVHGIPGDRVLKKGDIICIDCGVFKDGYFTDMAETVVVGGPDAATAEVKKFLKAGRKALFDAIAQAKPGHRIGHISKAMQNGVESNGYAIVKSLIGHGVGRELHEWPEVPGYLDEPLENTPLLVPGMTLALEVIYNMGSDEVVYANDDGWTIVTEDGNISAVFERSILITEKGSQILTPFPGEK